MNPKTSFEVWYPDPLLRKVEKRITNIKNLENLKSMIPFIQGITIVAQKSGLCVLIVVEKIL